MEAWLVVAFHLTVGSNRKNDDTGIASPAPLETNQRAINFLNASDFVNNTKKIERNPLHGGDVTPNTKTGDIVSVTTHDQIGQQSGPAGLMRGAEPLAVVAVKIFKEQQMFAPVGIGLPGAIGRKGRQAAVGIGAVKIGHPAGQAADDFAQGQRLVAESWRRNGISVAEKTVEFFQRQDQRVIGRQPDRAAPVRIAAE